MKATQEKGRLRQHNAPIRVNSTSICIVIWRPIPWPRLHALQPPKFFIKFKRKICTYSYYSLAKICVSSSSFPFTEREERPSPIKLMAIPLKSVRQGVRRRVGEARHDSHITRRERKGVREEGKGWGAGDMSRKEAEEGHSWGKWLMFALFRAVRRQGRGDEVSRWGRAWRWQLVLESGRCRSGQGRTGVDFTGQPGNGALSRCQGDAVVVRQG